MLERTGSVIWRESRSGLGECLLTEERRIRDQAVEVEDDTDQRSRGSDHERSPDLPVHAWHGPRRVVVVGRHVVVEPEAPATKEIEDQAAGHGKDALHPQVAHAASQVSPGIPGAGETG